MFDPAKLFAAFITLVLTLPLSSTAQEILLEGHVDIERDTPNVVIQDTSSGSTFLIAARPTVSFFGTFTNSNFGIRVNNTDLIRLTTALRVGIGTASPISRLHVKGDVRVEGGSFIDDGNTLNVPDYVFEDRYSLMPTEQLAEYIDREKHLPNVPSAKEINENGVDIGAFQMLLLEKVEELTLYILEQDKTISNMAKENARLREELSDLSEDVVAIKKDFIQ